MNLFKKFVIETGHKYIKYGADKYTHNQAVDDLYIEWLENLIENMKCCGNCSQESPSTCGMKDETLCCNNWVFDEITKKEREL